MELYLVIKKKKKKTITKTTTPINNCMVRVYYGRLVSPTMVSHKKAREHKRKSKKYIFLNNSYFKVLSFVIKLIDIYTFLCRKVGESVLKFCRKIAGNSSDPSWMFCVPVIHFMFDNSKPFIKAPPRTNHDDRVPVWWGVVDFGNDIDHFKWQSKWDRYMSYI